MGEIADQMLDDMLSDPFGDTYWGGRDPKPPRCNRCGATDVRWRQQTGRWVLFSLQPGVEHSCPVLDPFDVIPD